MWCGFKTVKGKSKMLPLYQDKKKAVLRLLFWAFNPLFRVTKNSPLKPQKCTSIFCKYKSIFLLSKPHFLLSRNDFSFLESNNQTLVALSLKLIFTPFWHSAPKGGRSSPPDFRFFWRKITPNFPFIASTF